MTRMKILSLLAAVAFTASAHAALTIDPASLPPVVEQGVEFGPVRVIATDANGNRVPNASLRWVRFAAEIIAVDPEQRFCRIDGAGLCFGNADAQGVFTLPRMYTRATGVRRLDLASDLGNATIQVTAVPYSQPDSLVLESGANQRVVATSPLPQRFSVRARDASGRPLAGQTVSFFLQSGSQAGGGFGHPGSGVDVVTDAQGLAVAPEYVTSAGLGEGVIAYSMPMPGTHNEATGRVSFTATRPDGRTSLALQDMWWSGFAENGWGMSIAQHDDRLFAVAFAYGPDGQPTWYAQLEGGWLDGMRYALYGGQWYSPRGTPFFAYDTTRLQVGAPKILGGTRFSGDGAGQWSFSTGDHATVQRTKSIVRQDFTSDPPSPITGLGDMWWGGPSQSGWGISIMEQAGGLFSVWFTYDAAGLPTWFVMPAGSWSSNNTFEGAIYRTQSSAWPDYDAKRLQVIPVGTYRYRFTDLEHATFEYSVEGRTGTLSLVRQSF
jgi:hypothetical protein